MVRSACQSLRGASERSAVMAIGAAKAVKLVPSNSVNTRGARRSSAVEDQGMAGVSFSKSYTRYIAFDWDKAVHLERILAKTRETVAERKQRVSFRELEQRAAQHTP